MIDDQPKRKYRRRNLKVEVRVRDESGAGEVVFDTHDISIGGCFLRSDLLLELGEILDLEIPLKGHDTPLRVQAKVVRAVRGNEQKSGPGMGIEFINPSQALRDALTGFLSG
ncbi:MAG: PilZ domain-containing protein [Deltaproteobacteria bacterium]|nr:PilZ domain-containing protein [Deltaproteobacteria bacterium]